MILVPPILYDLIYQCKLFFNLIPPEVYDFINVVILRSRELDASVSVII